MSHVEFRERLGVRDAVDWYQVTAKDVRRINSGVLRHHKGSVQAVVRREFPHEYGVLLPWKFKGGVPNRYWENGENIERAAACVREYVGVSDPVDWYRLSLQSFEDCRLSGFLRTTFRTTKEFVKVCFPADFAQLEEWRFTCPAAYWKESANRARAVEHLRRVLSIARPEHWYALRYADFVNAGLYGLIKFHGDSPQEFLRVDVKEEYDQLLP